MKEFFVRNQINIKFSAIIRLIWYAILLWKVLAYCKRHLDEVLILQPFTGNSIIFILLIILLIMPLLVKFNISGNEGIFYNLFDIFEVSKKDFEKQVLKYEEQKESSETKIVQDNLLRNIEAVEKDKGVLNV